MKKDSMPESWRWKRQGTNLVVEFLCPVPADGSKQPGQLHRPGGPVAGKLSALVLDAGEILTTDTRLVKRRVALKSGSVDFEFRVSGPLSWLVAKVDALERREKAKDAYDIVWLCESCQGGQPALAQELRASLLFSHAKVVGGLRRLRSAFADRDQLGPRQYAAFMSAQHQEQSMLRAVGAVTELFRALDRSSVFDP
jgi:hypothetical protein